MARLAILLLACSAATAMALPRRVRVLTVRRSFLTQEGRDFYLYMENP